MRQSISAAALKNTLLSRPLEKLDPGPWNIIFYQLGDADAYYVVVQAHFPRKLGLFARSGNDHRAGILPPDPQRGA